MHARVATFESQDPETHDQMVEAIRKDVESGNAPPGLEHAKGMMMLSDRDKGKSVGIIFFDNEEDLKRGDEVLNAMSPEGGVRRTAVEFYEVPFHRMN
jgi:hypothetical protein